MNIYEDFIKYQLHSVHIKDNPTGDGLSFVPVTDYQLTSEEWDSVSEGIYELLNDGAFTDGEYDFMCGSLTAKDGVIVFTGAQTREVRFTKLFKTPVPA